MRFFEKFSKERYTPLYPFQKGIKGYKVFSLPVSFQDFAFEIQRALLRCFDWMQLPAFRQVNDILPGAAQYLRRLRCIDNSVRGKVPEILNSQRNAFAYPVEHRIRDGHVHIPCNAILCKLMERAAATRCSSQIICLGKGACKGHPHPFAFVSR